MGGRGYPYTFDCGFERRVEEFGVGCAFESGSESKFGCKDGFRCGSDSGIRFRCGFDYRSESKFGFGCCSEFSSQSIFDLERFLCSFNQSVKDPNRATHGHGDAELSTATGGRKP